MKRTSWRMKFIQSLILTGAFAATTNACLHRPIEQVDPRRTSTVSGALPQTRIDKVDILLVIDDSTSMADKQAI
ncbi:MAG: hypothetical protein VB934_08225, partial [Polyangiaceae bacterium]